MFSSFPTPAQALPYGQFRFDYVGAGPLGEGGLGRVHRVRILASNAPGKPVGSEWAVKRLNPQWDSHPGMRQRFEREISALKRMSHPNIVTFEGENLPGAERFYMMPLFAHTLRRHIAEGGLRGNWRAIAQHGSILAKAMQYAHDQGFIHRDFKPDNVLFNSDGPLVIADWGLGYFVHRSSVVLQHLTVGGMGTEYYCSAEQWATGKCDCRGDIYSLGMTLDEWLTGRQRAITVGAGLQDARTAPTGSLGADRFNALLVRMTRFASRERPASMRDVARELDVLAQLAW